MFEEEEKISQSQSWIDSACWFGMISIKSLSVNWIWTNSKVMFIWIRIVENVHKIRKNDVLDLKWKGCFYWLKSRKKVHLLIAVWIHLFKEEKNCEFDIHRMSQFHWTLIERFVYRSGVHTKSEYGKPGRCLNNKQRAS